MGALRQNKTNNVQISQFKRKSRSKYIKISLNYVENGQGCWIFMFQKMIFVKKFLRFETTLTELRCLMVMQIFQVKLFLPLRCFLETMRS